MSLWLQWISIIGIGLGLIAAIAMLFVNKEISSRFDVRLIQSNENATEAKNVATEIIKKQQPRIIENDQKEALVSSLANFPEGLSLAMCPQGNREAKDYAQQLSGVFNKAGIITHVSWWMGDPLPDGITVGTRSKEFDNIAYSILQSLSNSGIFAKCTRDAPFDQENINILVGPKL